MAERIVFPKQFITRAEKYDFRDDGNFFKGYLYKGILPISYLRAYGEIYLTIRVDYTIPYDAYRKSDIRTERYNGVDPSYFNMETFLDDCEKCFQFVTNYKSPEAELKRIQEEIEKINSKIEYLTRRKAVLNSKLKNFNK